MIYCNVYGQSTDDNSMLNSFNLTQKNLKEVAKEIALIIKDTHCLFCNIQIPEECSQYDILFSINYYNQGLHQRGIRNRDLLIGVIGRGLYGFECNTKNETELDYYTEKLDICTYFLRELFNEVRNEIGRW